MIASSLKQNLVFLGWKELSKRWIRYTCIELSFTVFCSCYITVSFTTQFISVLVYSLHFSAKPKNSLIFVTSCLSVFVDLYFNPHLLTSSPFVSLCYLHVSSQFLLWVWKPVCICPKCWDPLKGGETKLEWVIILGSLKAGTNFKGSLNLGAIAQMNPKPFYVLLFLSSSSLLM